MLDNAETTRTGSTSSIRRIVTLRRDAGEKKLAALGLSSFIRRTQCIEKAESKQGHEVTGSRAERDAPLPRNYRRSFALVGTREDERA